MLKNTTNPDLLRTAKLPACTMAQLVYGKPVKRVRLPARLIFIAAVVSTMYGCATGRPVTVDAPETVGQLAPSYASIAVAPLKHDAPPELGQVVDTDQDAPVTVTARTDAGEPDALPEVAPKTDGVTAGAAR